MNNLIDIHNDLREFLEFFGRMKSIYKKDSSLDLIEDLIKDMILAQDLNAVLTRYSLLKDINKIKYTTLGDYTEEFLNKIFYED